ncbi:MAG: 50S ribosomal protein L22 [Planctomycetes bacterium]|nr:50S ribosomal protein L22 [Planctomycetota bacterium]
MGQIFRSKVIHPTRLEKGNDQTSKRVYPDGRYGATLRGIRIAPNKVRLVADQIRGEQVERAREILRYSHKKAAYLIDRVLLSALGNADVKSEGRVGAGDLFVAETYVDEGPRLKRFLAGPKGGARPIMRRMCHITVVLGEPKDEQAGTEKLKAEPAAAKKEEPKAEKAESKPKKKAAPKEKAAKK